MHLRQPDTSEAPTPHASGSPHFIIVADDLTGACDAVIAFAPVSSPVRVHLGPELLSTPGVSAITTGSRHLPLEDAESRLATIAGQLPPGAELFKKIDSVFRGNTFAEIATSIRLFPADLVILAPAYPAMERRMRTGVLHVQHPANEHTMPRPESVRVEEQLRAGGCHPRTLPGVSSHEPGVSSHELLSDQMQRARAQGSKVMLCDAWEQADLTATVQAARSLDVRTLWIGSGGLAHALAAQWKPLGSGAEPQLRAGHTVFFIGSDHPATRRQVVDLQHKSGLPAYVCGREAPRTGDLLLTVPRGSTSEDDVCRATEHLQPQDVACLFVTGGDTALLVCAALGIRSLRLRHEFAPGVPLGIAEGGRFDGISVILKSGGFGKPDVLCRVLDAFRRKECVLGS